MLASGSVALDMVKANKLSPMEHITRVNGFSEGHTAKGNFIIRQQVTLTKVNLTMILCMDQAG